jgi:hypothetical protein
VIVSIHEPFFRKSGDKDFEWDMHLPIRICSPMLLLNRLTYSDATERDFNREAKALFNFSTSIAATKPPARPSPTRSARPIAMLPALKRERWTTLLEKRSLPRCLCPCLNPLRWLCPD